MKILWFPRLQPDIEKLHLTTWREMCRAFESLGCTVKIAIAGKDKDNILARESVHIFIIKKKFFRVLSYWISGFAEFIYHYIKFKPDIVLLDIFSIWFSIPFIFNKKRKTVFLIDNRTPFYCKVTEKQTFRDIIFKFYTRLTYMFCKRFLDGMTVITDYYKEYVHKNFEFPYASIEVWGSGVDINMFAPQKYENLSRPDILKNKFVVMQHGEFSNNRGIFETVEAMSLIDNENVCLLLVGDGSVKNDILRRIEEFGVENKVHIVPPVDHSDIPKYISFCDCAIMAYPDIEYWNNNNPIKLIEYLAMGKVIICSDIWTFRSIGNDMNCMHYIKDNSPETIAGAIVELYRNRGRLCEFGKDGIEVVEKNFTWHSHAKRVLDFCDELRKKLVAGQG
jgi:glycosyltransferase involved in cell wall biosynthesis